MERCIKCSKIKQIKQIIIIKRKSHEKLYKTLFKNNFDETRICKYCFGELMNENAEFLGEEDIIDEIPTHWMQEENVCDYPKIKLENITMINEYKFEDAKATKSENLQTVKETENFELEIPVYEIQTYNSNQKNQGNCQIEEITVYKAENNIPDTQNIVDDTEELHIPPIFVIEDDSSEETNTPTLEIDDDNDSTYATEASHITNFQNEHIEMPYIPTFHIEDNSASCDDQSTVFQIEDSSSDINGDEMRILLDYEERCKQLDGTLTEKSNNTDSIFIRSEVLSNTSENNNTLNPNVLPYIQTSELAYICSGCGQVSDKKWKIQEHNALGGSACFGATIEEIIVENTIVCEYCGLFYRRPIDLQAHRATGIHSDLIYHCSECSEQFNELNFLNMHKQKHNLKRLKFNQMFLCNVGNCNEICQDWASLSRHKVRSHIAQICPVCKEVFNDSRVFVNHLKNCKNSKNYKVDCSICGKQFSNTITLAGHVGLCIKLIPCKYCKRRLKSKTALNEHIYNQHSPFDCRNCGKLFKARRYCLVHMKRYCRKEVISIS